LTAGASHITEARSTLFENHLDNDEVAFLIKAFRAQYEWLNHNPD
jgi:hypothetical protein